MMMKRILKFLAIVTIIVISATFVACNDKKDEPTDVGVTQEAPKKKEAPVENTDSATENTSVPEATGEEPVGDDVEDPLVKTKICVPNEIYNGVKVIETEVREITAREILIALCNEGVVKGNAEVIGFKQEGKVLTLNLSQGFVEGINERGLEKEHYTIASVVNSFLYNFKAEKIFILVDGKAWKTKQAVYGTQPFIKISN